jgi:hypothetical protein
VLVSGGLAAALVVGFFAASGTTVYGWLIDAHCAHYFRGSAAAEHPVGCNLGEGCRDVGWGVMTSSGEYLKFDPSGDQTALKILQTTSATKDLEIRVTGRKRGTEFVVRRMAVVNGGEARTAEFSQVLLFASH